MTIVQLKDYMKSNGIKPLSGKKAELIARIKEYQKIGTNIYEENDEKITPVYIQKEETKFEQMKVDELKQLLKQNGLKVSGKKSELVQRLVDANVYKQEPVEPKKTWMQRLIESRLLKKKSKSATPIPKPPTPKLPTPIIQKPPTPKLPTPIIQKPPTPKPISQVKPKKKLPKFEPPESYEDQKDFYENYTTYGLYGKPLGGGSRSLVFETIEEYMGALDKCVQFMAEDPNQYIKLINAQIKDITNPTLLRHFDALLLEYAKKVYDIQNDLIPEDDSVFDKYDQIDGICDVLAKGTYSLDADRYEQFLKDIIIKLIEKFKKDIFKSF
jgi:hypothetical protein